ncbi:MAG: c-type cytochrome, partial [Pirellulaceae bacterium]|nr:c-type cytochrome [Pirellulaceae bacterium]
DSGFAEFPLPWQRQLFAHLNSPDARVAQKSLVAMASTTSGQFDEGLLQSIEEVALPVALRVRAAKILSRQSKDIPETTFALLCSQCSQDTAFDTRLEAARAIGNLKLTSQQVNRVIDLVAQAGPLELPLLLQPLTGLWRTLSKTSSRRLLAALEKAPGFASLQETVLTNLFQEAPAEIRVAAQPLLQRLQEEYASSIREVLRTTFNLVGGDPSRGKEIFFGKRALCSACHRVGPQKGKEIGPDLRRIGEVRSPRDLLEAILAPSASLARGFEGQTVVTTSGRVISGVLHQETDDFIVLFTSQREEVRIPRSDVEEINASAVSIMPAGLERLLTSDELRDLLAYLGSLQIR